MSGKKITDVRACLQVSDEKQAEVGRISDLVKSTCKEIAGFGIDGGRLRQQLEKLTSDLQQFITSSESLIRGVNARAQRGEMHGFDSEYNTAQSLGSKLGTITTEFRKLQKQAEDELHEARLKHKERKSVLSKELSGIEEAITSMRIEIGPQKWTIDEFTAVVGAHSGSLKKIRADIDKAHQFLKAGKLDEASKTLSVVRKTWQDAREQLLTLRDVYEGDHKTLDAVERFLFSRGYETVFELVNGTYRLTAEKGGSKYDIAGVAWATNPGDGQQTWVTPHGAASHRELLELQQSLWCEGIYVEFIGLARKQGNTAETGDLKKMNKYARRNSGAEE
ncbi:MAG: hypothetical protein ACKO2L_15190 [Planctomycetaceae bacterium]